MAAVYIATHITVMTVGIKSIDKNPIFKKLAKQVLEERKQEVKV